MSLYIEAAKFVAERGVELGARLRASDEGFIKCSQVALSVLQAISLYRGVEITPRLQKTLTASEVLYFFGIVKLPNTIFGVVNASTIAREGIFEELEKELRQHKGFQPLTHLQQDSSVVLANVNEEKLRQQTKDILTKLLGYNWIYAATEDNVASECYTSVDHLKILLKKRLADDLGLNQAESDGIVGQMNVHANIPTLISRVISLDFISNLSFSIVDIECVFMYLQAWGADFSSFIDQIGEYKVFGFVKSLDLEVSMRVGLIIGYGSNIIQACKTAVYSTEIRKREYAVWDIVKSATEIGLNIASMAKVNQGLLVAGTIATKSIGVVSVLVRLYREHQ